MTENTPGEARGERRPPRRRGRHRRDPVLDGPGGTERPDGWPDDESGGSAGVREPRRPKPSGPLAGAREQPEPEPFLAASLPDPRS